MNKTDILKLAALMAISSPSLAGVDFTLSQSIAQFDEIKDGYEARATISRGNWNVWGSYGEHDQIMLTQSVGDLSILAAGVGYRHRLSDTLGLYIDAGYAKTDQSYRDRIIKEATWFSFAPIFLPAHWLPDENYLQENLEFQNDFDAAPMLRIGTRIEVTERLVADVSYRYFKPKQFMSIKNPDLAEQSGWWEGTFTRDLSTINVGLSWSF